MDDFQKAVITTIENGFERLAQAIEKAGRGSGSSSAPSRSASSSSGTASTSSGRLDPGAGENELIGFVRFIKEKAVSKGKNKGNPFWSVKVADDRGQEEWFNLFSPNDANLFDAAKLQNKPVRVVFEKDGSFNNLVGVEMVGGEPPASKSTEPAKHSPRQDDKEREPGADDGEVDDCPF